MNKQWIVPGPISSGSIGQSSPEGRPSKKQRLEDDGSSKDGESSSSKKAHKSMSAAFKFPQFGAGNSAVTPQKRGPAISSFISTPSTRSILPTTRFSPLPSDHQDIKYPLRSAIHGYSSFQMPAPSPATPSQPSAMTSVQARIPIALPTPQIANESSVSTPKRKLEKSLLDMVPLLGSDEREDQGPMGIAEVEKGLKASPRKGIKGKHALPLSTAATLLFSSHKTAISLFYSHPPQSSTADVIYQVLDLELNPSGRKGVVLASCTPINEESPTDRSITILFSISPTQQKLKVSVQNGDRIAVWKPWSVLEVPVGQLGTGGAMNKAKATWTEAMLIDRFMVLDDS